MGRRGSGRLAWDLSRAVFPDSGGPEPESGYYLAVSVDRDLVLVAGDLEAEARKKTKMIPIERTVMISRREHVATGAELSYSTTASFGGKRRSIAIDLGGEMNLTVDGKRILQIRRLRWKFRGSERVELGGGDRIQVSWDLHSWMFPAKKDDVEREEEGRPQAMFVFRFEGEGHFGNSECFEYLGKNWSESGSNSSGGGERKGKGRREKEEMSKKKKSLLMKTSSSSSSSSVSSGGSSTVMDWWSKEEEDLQSRRGFTLLVYAWKG